MISAEPQPAVPTGEHARRTPLPPPLVHLYRHPIRWVRNKAELVVAAIVLAHVGMLIIAGLYYLLFETVPAVTSAWHTVVSNSQLRHSIRDVGEGVLGGFLAQGIVWNHFKRSHMRSGRLVERLHRRTGLPGPLVALLSTILLGAIGFVAGYYALRAFHAHAAQTHSHGSTWYHVQSIWRGNWDKKVLGYVVSLLARRPMFVVFDTVQRWFAERRVDLGKPVRWYHPPTFKARYNYLVSQNLERERHPWWQAVLMIGGLLAGLAMAGFGFWVLTYRA